MDTLALGYSLPAIRVASGLAPVRQCSCRAYQKIGPVSRQGLLQTQTQNKTRQNYYAVCLSMPGRQTRHPSIFTYRCNVSNRLCINNKCMRHLFIIDYSIICLTITGCLFHEASAASSMRNAMYLRYWFLLSNPIHCWHVRD